MCTALTLTTSDTYFGRNLDLEYAFSEELVMTPRRCFLPFQKRASESSHYAMLGTAYVPEAFPLYYDAVNEHGLAMAALNFPHYAHYVPPQDGALAPFEVIPYVLGNCRSVREACDCLSTIPIAAQDYSASLPVTPLHWLIADNTDCVALEPLADGVHLTENHVGVLTNSPPLAEQLNTLSSYTTLTPHTPPAAFGNVELTLHSRGMGSGGLPGGYASSDRFVRAAFGKVHSACDAGEAQSVMQVFHLLDSVAMPRGSVVMPDGRCEITMYSCCMNLRTGAYYYKTYNGSAIHAVDLHLDDVEGQALVRRPMCDVFDVRLP